MYILYIYIQSCLVCVLWHEKNPRVSTPSKAPQDAGHAQKAELSGHRGLAADIDHIKAQEETVEEEPAFGIALAVGDGILRADCWKGQEGHNIVISIDIDMQLEPAVRLPRFAYGHLEKSELLMSQVRVEWEQQLQFTSSRRTSERKRDKLSSPAQLICWVISSGLTDRKVLGGQISISYVKHVENHRPIMIQNAIDQDSNTIPPFDQLQ